MFREVPFGGGGTARCAESRVRRQLFADYKFKEFGVASASRSVAVVKVASLSKLEELVFQAVFREMRLAS